MDSHKPCGTPPQAHVVPRFGTSWSGDEACVTTVHPHPADPVPLARPRTCAPPGMRALTSRYYTVSARYSSVGT
eukprot:14346714-Heterocapsa_arctica.AAC.1